MNRYIKLGWFTCMFAIFIPMALYGQESTTIKLDVTVRNENGVAVTGAFVGSELEDVLATTDSLGVFSLDVVPNTLLIIRAEGYSDKAVRATANLSELYLESDFVGNAVQVAYRSISRENLMGGISFVDVPELIENNYFTYSLSNMDGFVPGFHGNLWGNDEYLVLVDGVPRDPGSVMPLEIDQISFLKGVSAVALYGSRAAKGVVLITTKRGYAGKQTINVRANTGVNVPSRIPNYLGSAEYMTLYNEARTNDGLNPLYDQETIFRHASGENPYRYPNTNFYSPEYLQEAYSRHDATMEISGGNDRARYYSNLGFWSEGSLLDFGQASQNRNERLNVRGNVDVNITNKISAFVDAAVVFYNGRGVNANFWDGAANIRPHRFTPLIPVSMIEPDDQTSMNFVRNSEHLIDGMFLLGGTQLDQTNPIAGIYAGGSSQFTSRQYQFNTGVNADLGNVLEGLSFNSRFGLDYNTSYNLSFNNNYAVYQPSWNSYSGEDLISSLTRYGQDASTRTQNITDNWFQQTLSFSAQLNYFNTFKRDHQVSAMLIAGGFQTATSGLYHRISNANLGLHLGYEYKNKYLVDFSGAVIHSARLPENNRQAFSPTLTLGWKMNKEGFMEGATFIDNLMFSVSGGIIHTDLDIAEYYMYQQSFTQQGEGTIFYTWKDGLNNNTTISRRGSNPNMAFPRREEINFGVDASFLNNKIGLTGSYFLSEMTGLLVQRNDIYPSHFNVFWPHSSFIPFENYNSDRRSGFDFSLNYRPKIGAVNFDLGFVGTYYKTQAVQRGEFWQDSYQNRAGNPIDAIWGLQNAGFFGNMNEVESMPEQIFGEVQQGDIRYVDQNGDGRVTPQDEVFLGRGGWFGSPLTLGINLTAKWNNFTFFALGVARTGAFAMRNNSYFWISGEDKYSEVVRDRWTEATATSATFPRLTTLNGANNFRNSDFWLYSTDRFDLARLQISYQIPTEKFFGGNFIKGMGVYVNGANLLTISPNKEILELNIGSAPQTRFFNLGVSAQF
ncbi:SusC/RagA family TonB-linked outer membrane protein [Belliella sp. DSM 107340]|uniref:SusC/RagA family TonB-linked outer membrane protein n=1 Tax=Belliella calami TaxID=2923436 RepID=A0ABS9UJ92_9BACT|nr:SusC/RagA family TonB-linked outer membrane protein [Belliella calami]MCH7396642.1 SusC/RagA family TonB-linked outer membrane protein [Belliella calami]